MEEASYGKIIFKNGRVGANKAVELLAMCAGGGRILMNVHPARFPSNLNKKLKAG